MKDLTVEWLLKGEPRDVQKEALLRAFYGYKTRDNQTEDPKAELIRPEGFARGFNYFMEMRLGKTPTALNEFMLMKKYEGVTKLIVIAPSSFKSEWKSECEKFGVDVPCHVVELSKFKKTQKFLQDAKGKFVIVINYEALTYSKAEKLFSDIADDQTMVVMDESVLLKNPRGKALKTILTYLTPHVKAIRCMTGMPITQGAHDMWAQMRASGTMSTFTNFFAFRHQFCEMGGYMGKKVIGRKNTEMLNQIINAHSFKAYKYQWLKTPGVEYVTVPITMTKEQMDKYTTMLSDSVLFESDTVISADMVITRAIKLQQITSGVVLDDERKVIQIVEPSKNAKLNQLKMLVSQTQGKVIVIAVFKATIDMLTSELEEYQPAVIRGEMKKDTLDEDKQRFNTDPNCKVIIGQSRAIKYGHTLMGSETDPCLTTIYFENSYSLDDRIQSEQRNQGSGQKGQIAVYDFVASGIDSKVIKALQKKDSVAKAIMDYRGEML